MSNFYTKFYLLGLLGVLFLGNAQGQDPAVFGSLINPAPATTDVGRTLMSVNLTNNSTTAVPLDPLEPLFISISTSRFIPDGSMPTGRGAEFFSWTLECSTNCDPIVIGKDATGKDILGPDPNIVYSYIGTQIAEIPRRESPFVDPGGPIEFNGTAIETSIEQASTTGGVGFNSNIIGSSVLDIELGNNTAATYTYTVTINPVELSSFNAQADGISGILNWTTETEENAGYYDVEASFNGVDFQFVDRIASKADASGNSKNKLFYSYEDKTAGLRGDAIYYRLKQVDLDEKFAYSGVRLVSFEDAEIASKVFPNPVHAGQSVVVQGNEIATIQVYSIDGRLVDDYSYNDSLRSTSLSTSELKPGSYFLVVNGKKKYNIVVQ